MKIELTKNQQKLKDELKEYFSALLNKELLSEMSVILNFLRVEVQNLKKH